MKPNRFGFGFRVLGPASEPRRLIDHAVAFRAHAECDPKAELNRECYLSSFQFDGDFAAHLDAHASPRGFVGPCWSQWLWLDIDREDVQTATHDARRVAAFTVDRWHLEGDELLIFFSGAKGYHIGLPLSRCGTAEPAGTFNSQCRRLAEHLAMQAGVNIDEGIYDRLRLLRAPNSRHPRTGRHKRRLTLDELMKTRPEGIVERAAEQRAFELPDSPATHPQAAADWQVAGEGIAQQSAALAGRGAAAKLNRQTRVFIQEGAITGDRHRLLYSASRNLAECGCPPGLVYELLTEPALDSGLSPAETRRQIACGLKDGGKDT
jgi:hypothetical protein